jgi:hypothetical protein
MKSPYAAEDRVSPARRDPISQLLLTQTDSNVNLLGIRAWGKVFISYARGDVIDDCRVPVFLRDIRYVKFSPCYLGGLRDLLASLSVDCPIPKPFESLFKLLDAAPPIRVPLVPEDIQRLGGRAATVRFHQPKRELQVFEFRGQLGRDIIECTLEGLEITKTDLNALLLTRQRINVYENVGPPISKSRGIGVIIGRPLWALNGGDFGKRYGNRVFFERLSFMEFIGLLLNHRQLISSRQTHFLPEEFDWHVDSGIGIWIPAVDIADVCRVCSATCRRGPTPAPPLRSMPLLSARVTRRITPVKSRSHQLDEKRALLTFARPTVADPPQTA